MALSAAAHGRAAKASVALRRALFTMLCIGSPLLIGSAIYGAIHSTLFTIRIVEVSGESEFSPLDNEAIRELAAVPVGKLSLFGVDLEQIESRIATSPWVSSVRIEKRFPQTLSITVGYRQPIAIVQRGATLEYVDGEGRSFEKMNALFQSNLPLIQGLRENTDRFSSALSLIKSWSSTSLGNLADLSSIQYDSEWGYRAWVTYRLSGSGDTVRSQIVFGESIESKEQLARIAQVIRYLSANQISASLLHADIGKKIVVKTGRRS